MVNNFKNSFGFTLVELLVVIAILAILSVVGAVQYYGINARARDSARKEDMYAITTALEVNKTAQGYTSLQESQFSSFQWADPKGNVYCIAAGSPTNPTGVWNGTCPSGFVAVAPGVPVGVFGSWKVCASLENSGVFCRTSRQ